MTVLLTPAEQKYLQIVEDINKPRGRGIDAGLKTRLHDGQIEALSPLYKKNKRIIFVPSGRKFGKTELAEYALYRQALLTPNSACYYITPESSHGRKIVWDTWRLQHFLMEDAHKYIKSIKNVEMKIELKNQSFIQVIGSENFGSANGLTPHIAVYDEFKVFHHRWHIDFSPNLIPNSAPLIIIGTLPTPGDRNSEQYYEVLEGCKQDKNSEVVFRTTFDNPLNLIEPTYTSLLQEIETLRRRGEEDVIQREFYSKIVPGGKRAIFPMFDPHVHVRKHDSIIDSIKRDQHKMEHNISVDPGSSTVFGGLFINLNRYTGYLYILDELYQKTLAETSTGKVLPLIREKALDVSPNTKIDDWLKVSDDAAVWFMNEAVNRTDGESMTFFAAEKWKGDRDEGISLLKDMFLANKIVISDRCKNLTSEITGYAIDSTGKISNKIPDHLIDSLRYALIALNYTFETLKETEHIQDEFISGRYMRPIDHDFHRQLDPEMGHSSWNNDGWDL